MTKTLRIVLRALRARGAASRAVFLAGWSLRDPQRPATPARAPREPRAAAGRRPTSRNGPGRGKVYAPTLTLLESLGHEAMADNRQRPRGPGLLEFVLGLPLKHGEVLPEGFKYALQ